ncbi:MAG TPA: hypothetical protein VG796_27880 [Verrucomicrobiales bacterium]|nr:hypothetical protein [Verrucomicrobiales bacterium]
MSAKRFRIAFSFAGEKRDFVEKVAALLAAKFGTDAIFYDKFHEAEFARPANSSSVRKIRPNQTNLSQPNLFNHNPTLIPSIDPHSPVLL